MFTKIFNFVFLTAIAASCSLGCAHQQSAVEPKRTTPNVEATPLPPATPAKGYSIGAKGWTLVEESEMEGDEFQRVAEYEFKVDENLSFAAYVNQVKLDKEEAKTYLEDMRQAASATENIKLIGQRMRKVGEHDAYEALFAQKVTHGVALVISVSVVDSEGNAFLVTCGGNIKAGEQILYSCKPLLDSFRCAK